MASSAYFNQSQHGHAQLIELVLPLHLDAREFDRLNDEVQKAVDASPDGAWVLDMSQAAYMGSAILGLMVNLRQRIKSGGGELVLCSLSPRLMEIFHACSLERLFTFARTRADAIALTSR